MSTDPIWIAPRIWFDEVERIGMQRCTPVGYAINSFGGALWLFGILAFLGTPAYLAYRGFVGTFYWLALAFNSGENTSMTNTATYAVPDLKLPVCPWCKRSSDKYYLLAYDRNGLTEFEVMCAQCEAAATQFAQMQQNGISRQDILEDFGFRGRDAPWPNKK
jgi:hypothetical protein